MDQVFLKNKNSVIEALKVIDRFSKVSGLKHNTLKCNIVGIGGLKGVNVAHSVTCNVLI